MKNSDYFNIKTIEELRRARFENDVRLVHLNNTLNHDIDAVRKSLTIGNLVSSMFDNTLSFVSNVNFFRRGYFWVRSFLRNMASDTVGKTPVSESAEKSSSESYGDVDGGVVETTAVEYSKDVLDDVVS